MHAEEQVELAAMVDELELRAQLAFEVSDEFSMGRKEGLEEAAEMLQSWLDKKADVPTV